MFIGLGMGVTIPGQSLESQALAIAQKYSASVYLPEAGSYVVGPELVVNGNFSAGTTGWNLTQPTSGSVSIADGQATINSADGSWASVYQPGFTPVAGKTYQLQFEVVSSTGAGVRADFGGVSGTTIGSAPGRYQQITTAINSSSLMNIGRQGITNTVIDNISVREILSVSGNATDSALTSIATNDGSVGGVKGQAIGPELVTNGGFDSGMGWSLVPNTQTATISGGVARVASVDGSSTFITQAALQPTPGKAYLITVDIVATSGGGLLIDFGGATSAALNTIGAKSFIMTPTTTVALVAKRNGVCDVTFDNLSVRELGYIATQTTAGFKPLLVGGARNLLVYSEDFSNAIWQKIGSVPAVITPNAAVAPDGTTTAAEFDISGAIDSRIAHNIIAPALNINGMCNSVWIKAKTSAGTIGMGIRKADGTTTAQLISVTTEWARYSIYDAGAAGAISAIQYYGNRLFGGTCFNYYVWHPQLEYATANTPGTYVPTTSAAASSGSRPRSWLFDGTDDRLSLSGPPF